jgi:hypothetical protein
MTNIPYDSSEKSVWLSTSDRSTLVNRHFRSALRIDMFMQRNWQPIADILAGEGYPQTRQALGKYLEKWIGIMSPEYLMVNYYICFIYMCF